MPRAALATHLTLEIAPGTAPLRHRIADAVIAAVREGRVCPGEPLPSTRTLAESFGVSRGAVVAAYDELAAAGFVLSRAGSATVISPEADRAAALGVDSHVPSDAATQRNDPAPHQHPLLWDLRPGHPDSTLVDATAWRRAWTAAGRSRPGRDADQLLKDPALPRALAEHLRRHRGITTPAQDVLTTPGVSATLWALPDALGLAGQRVGVEDPCYIEARITLTRCGVDVVPIRTDVDGLDPAGLDDSLAAVYVTPAHHYPLGGRLPAGRRAALLEWASGTGGLVIEDDYDGEFRYDVSPLPPLRAMPGSAEHVIYLGTASKVLTPTLRLSWVVAPARLRARLQAELLDRSLLVPEPVQLAAAHLLTSGAWTAHHARVARTYGARRAALVAALSRHLPEAPLMGVDAGLHLVLRLPDSSDDCAVRDTLQGKGIAVQALTAYAIESTARGLVLCYAALPETAADAVAGLIAETTRALAAGEVR